MRIPLILKLIFYCFSFSIFYFYVFQETAQLKLLETTKSSEVTKLCQKVLLCLTESTPRLGDIINGTRYL